MIWRGKSWVRDLRRQVGSTIEEQVGHLAQRYGLAKAAPTGQDLDPYWDPKMAALLETWGEDNAWLEVQLLFALARGKVLDIACGTGRVMQILANTPALEIHGVDISDFLIGKATARGIPRERLSIGDATKMPYEDGSFDYAYSIGSLEHFTEDGLAQLVMENRRVVHGTSCHMVPVSRTDRDEGWIKRQQSYHNNSVAWWREHFARGFSKVEVRASTWSDDLSLGKWFICS